MHIDCRTRYQVGIVLTLIVLAVILVMYAYLSPQGFLARQQADLRVTDATLTVPYTDLEGNVVSLRDFEGAPLVVNVWASWTPFSQSELPIIAQVAATYGDRITVVAMNRMEDRERVKAYLASIGQPSGIRYLIDPTDHFFTTVSGYAMPETIVFDSIGNVVFHRHGTITENELTQALEILFAAD